jgi:hypothetical protein
MLADNRFSYTNEIARTTTYRIATTDDAAIPIMENVSVNNLSVAV